jgi:hypothetical protein
MSNEKNVMKALAVRNQVMKVEALMYSADKMIDEFETTVGAREELERFLNLFYMAVDATKELKDIAEGL